MKIQHLGLAVANVEEALAALGLSSEDITETVHDTEQKNKLYFVYLKEDDLWLEFVEPQEPTSSVGNFVRRNGMGLHHLATMSSDLKATESKMSKKEGAFVLGRYAINVKSFGGNIKTLFISFKGLIIEYVSKV